MKVAYDPQTFLRQRAGGISRLFTDLIVEYHADPTLGVDADLPFRWVNNSYAARDLKSMGIRGTPAWLPREVLYGSWLLRPTVMPRGADIVHHTYYSGHFLKPVGGARRVCTVYDMIPELFAGTDSFTGSHLRKRDYVMSSDLVICISDSTRRDMLDIYGGVPGTVVVVPSAVGPGFSPQLPPLASLPSEYLLYVGAREGYKDFLLLPEAIRTLRAHSLEVPVVVVGPPFTRSEAEHFESKDVTKLFLHHSLDDDELKRAYSNAVGLVQTSRYEGFGMTPLEGMASGIPVIVANSSSMPEVGGEVARYFAPGDAESLAGSITEILGAAALRSELGRRGVDRAARFTSRAMAERTADAYRMVVGND